MRAHAGSALCRRVIEGEDEYEEKGESGIWRGEVCIVRGGSNLDGGAVRQQALRAALEQGHEEGNASGRHALVQDRLPGHPQQLQVARQQRIELGHAAGGGGPCRDRFASAASGRRLIRLVGQQRRLQQVQLRGGCRHAGPADKVHDCRQRRLPACDATRSKPIPKNTGHSEEQ